MGRIRYKNYWITDCENHLAVMVYPVKTKKPNEYLVDKAFDVGTAKKLIDAGLITEQFYKVHTKVHTRK